MATWPTLGLWVALAATVDDPVDPATSGNWSNVGAYVRNATVQRGSSRFDGVIVRYEPATSSIVLENGDARFDPANLSGPYVAGGVTNVQPVRPFALQATWDSVRYHLFRGWADSWDPTYPLHGNDAIVTLRGSDTLAQISRIDLVNENSLAEVSPHASQVINSFVSPALNGALTLRWTTQDNNDGVLCRDFPDPPGISGNALAGAQLAAETEAGELYVNAQNDLQFRTANDVLTDARSATSQATFEPGTTLPFADVGVSYDQQPIKNHAVIAYAPGGTAIEVGPDLDSLIAYGRHSFSRTDLLHTTDDRSLDFGNYLVQMLKAPELRIDTLTIDPQAAPATLFPQVLGRELGDRITVTFTPPGGDEISRDVFIRGISHTIGPASWSTKWTLQDATRFDAFLIWDDAERGLWDTGRWGL